MERTGYSSNVVPRTGWLVKDDNNCRRCGTSGRRHRHRVSRVEREPSGPSGHTGQGAAGDSGAELPPESLDRREQDETPGPRRSARAVLRRAVVVPASARHRAVAATARTRDRVVQRRHARSRPSPPVGSSTAPARGFDHPLAATSYRRGQPPRRGAVPDGVDRHLARRVAERRDRRPQRRTDRHRAPVDARPRTHRVHR